MSIQERNSLRKEAYKEALRYMDNAEEALDKAGKEGRYYADAKYVRSASGTAYSGMLLALDVFLRIKGITMPGKGRKSIDWYKWELRNIDWKLLKEVNHAYSMLHLAGYYEGDTNVKTIDSGIESAYSVIKRIKPVVN